MSMLAPTAAPAAAGGKQQKAALRPNTRQRLQKVFPVVSAALGTAAQVTFPQVGLLSRIFIYANLTVTDTINSTSTVSTFGPFNLLKRITGATNLGTATLFDLSGYGAFMVDKVTDTTVETRAENYDVTAGANSLYAYPSSYVATVAKPVQFILMIPVTANDGPQFAVGLINLQAPELRFTLSLTFGAQTDAYSFSGADVLTLGGTVTVYYSYYEVPNPDQVQLPARVLHRLIEDRTAIAAAGDVTYLVPRQGVALQILHNVILNGAISKNTTDVVSRRLVFNKTDTAYNQDRIVDMILNRFRYGFGGLAGDVPGGTFVWDFFDADQAPSRGDLRDAIDTEALSTLESIVTLASGVTLGSGNNFLDTIRRITQSY